MRQTICQSCKAANKKEAVVCASCGARLTHEEDTFTAKLRDKGVFDRIRTAPYRLIRWLLKKIKLLCMLLLFTVIFGGGMLFFLLFVPLSWPEYKEPAREAVIADEAALEALENLNAGELQILLNADSANSFGNLLLRPIPRKTDARKQNAPAAAAPTSGLPARLKELQLTGFFSARKSGDNFYEFVLTGRVRGKLPWRLLITFAANREKDGVMELSRIRLGNLMLSESAFRALLPVLLREIAPDEQITAFLPLVESGAMGLVHNNDGRFTLRIRPQEKRLRFGGALPIRKKDPAREPGSRLF